MFPSRFFNGRFWARRYWPAGSTVLDQSGPLVGPWSEVVYLDARGTPLQFKMRQQRTTLETNRETVIHKIREE